MVYFSNHPKEQYDGISSRTGSNPDRVSRRTDRLSPAAPESFGGRPPPAGFQQGNLRACRQEKPAERRQRCRGQNRYCFLRMRACRNSSTIRQTRTGLRRREGKNTFSPGRRLQKTVCMAYYSGARFIGGVPAATIPNGREKWIFNRKISNKSANFKDS